jgi:hypothetical protein
MNTFSTAKYIINELSTSTKLTQAREKVIQSLCTCRVKTKKYKPQNKTKIHKTKINSTTLLPPIHSNNKTPQWHKEETKYYNQPTWKA